MKVQHYCYMYTCQSYNSFKPHAQLVARGRLICSSYKLAYNYVPQVSEEIQIMNGLMDTFTVYSIPVRIYGVG